MLSSPIERSWVFGDRGGLLWLGESFVSDLLPPNQCVWRDVIISASTTPRDMFAAHMQSHLYCKVTWTTWLVEESEARDVNVQARRRLGRAVAPVFRPHSNTVVCPAAILPQPPETPAEQAPRLETLASR